MKNLFLCISATMILASCINSSTNFTNRSVTNMATHELIGERAQVSESPHSADNTVNAEKTNETNAKIDAGQAVNDNSTNDQSKKAAEEAPKAEEKSDK